jgi:flagellar hook-associated protein 3 FlgL
MSIDRVGTSAQTQLFLSQIMQASNALTRTQTQVASGKVASDYAGIGDKTAVLEAARAASGRIDGYKSSTQVALNQVDMQNTQLTTLSDLSGQLRKAVTDAVANNDSSTLMTQMQSIFDQTLQVLNSQDPNGNYMYGGDKDNVPPVSASTLADLQALPSAAAAFSNGTLKHVVRTGDGEQVTYGVLASDIGTQLLQTIKDVADFNAGVNGNFNGTLSQVQSNFLSNTIGSATSAETAVNNAAASNGFVYNRLSDASDQQGSLSTMYTGFVSDLENVDMGEAVTRLNQNQVALQAALQVTSQLGQISLLNYLSAPAR